VKYIIGNCYFQPIAAHCYDRYPNRGDFKRYVSCSDLPPGTDCFQWGVLVLEVRGKSYRWGKPVLSLWTSKRLFISLAHCPRIHIEVCSDPLHERDCYRLLLQAGLLVRTMNINRGQGISFISIAIYLSKDLTAEWYRVYQPSRVDRTVGITKLLITNHWSPFLLYQENFDLNSRLDLLRFFLLDFHLFHRGSARPIASRSEYRTYSPVSYNFVIDSLVTFATTCYTESRCYSFLSFANRASTI